MGGWGSYEGVMGIVENHWCLVKRRGEQQKLGKFLFQVQTNKKHQKSNDDPFWNIFKERWIPKIVMNYHSAKTKFTNTKVYPM